MKPTCICGNCAKCKRRETRSPEHYPRNRTTYRDNQRRYRARLAQATRTQKALEAFNAEVAAISKIAYGVIRTDAWA